MKFSQERGAAAPLWGGGGNAEKFPLVLSNDNECITSQTVVFHPKA